MSREQTLLSDGAAELAGFTVRNHSGAWSGNGMPVADMMAAERGAADFLTALGIRLDSDELRETPARMARAYAELFDLRPFRLTTFPNEEGYDELVLARDIPFRTVCAPCR